MSEEFCDGVKILLKRMESNPEEFRGGNSGSRWQHVLHMGENAYPDWSHALTPAEIGALKDGIRKIYRDVFTETVMSTLLEDKEEEPLTASSGWTDPRGVFISTGRGGGGGYTVGRGLKVDTNGAIYNPTQNSITATNNTSYASITQDAKKLGLGEMLKQKLAKL